MTGGRERFLSRCWTSYEIDQDFREWPLTWRLTLAPGYGSTEIDEIVELLDANPVARVYVDATLVGTGRCDAWEPGISRTDGSYINVEGQGVLGACLDDAMPLGWSPRNLTIGQAVESVLAKWAIRVVGSNAANRAACTMRTVLTRGVATARVDTHTNALGHSRESIEKGTVEPDHTHEVADDRPIRPRPEESRGSWLRRFLGYHNLTMWECADGSVFVGLPNYNQRPMGDIVLHDRIAQFGGFDLPEGRVLDSRAPRRPGRQHTHVIVTGRIGRGGALRVHRNARDEGLISRGYDNRLIVSDDEVRDEAQAHAKALAIMAAERMPTLEYEATIVGHGLGRYLLAGDTIIRVRDAACHLNGVNMYVVKRSFTYDRKQGARVKLGAVRKGTWVPSAE